MGNYRLLTGFVGQWVAVGFLCLVAQNAAAEKPVLNSSETTATQLCLAFDGTADALERQCRYALTEFSHSNYKLAVLQTNLGRALSDQNKSEDAITQFKAAQELNPTYASAWKHLGWAYWDLDQWQPSVDAFEHSFSLSPTAESLAGQSSSMWRGDIDLDGALALVDRALQIDPDYPWAVVEKGWILNEQGHYDEAEKVFRGAVALRETYGPAHYGLSKMLHELGRDDEALSAVNRAIDLLPKKLTYYTWRASLFRSQEKYGRALSDATRAMEIDPSNKYAIVALALAHDGRGDTTRAMGVYEEAHKNGHGSNLMYYRQSELLTDEEQWDAAIEALDRAILYPEADHYDYNQRAYVFLQKDQYLEAKDASIKALDYNDAYVPALINLAFSEVGLDQPSRAFDAIKRALDHDADEEDINSFVAFLMGERRYVLAVRVRAEAARREK